MGKGYTYRYTTKEELQKYIAQKMTIGQIAEATGTSYYAIQGRLKKFGLRTFERRGSHHRIYPRSGKSMVFADEINGMGINIGDKIGGLKVTGVYPHFVTLKKPKGYTVTATYVDIWQAKLKQSKGALG